VICTALDECHKPGNCDTTNGICTNPLQPDQTPCAQGVCVGGVCTAVPDAGSGNADGGSGLSDGGGQPDSGTSSKPTPFIGWSCGCSAGAGSPSAALMMLAALGLRRRRQRARGGEVLS
jgi:MYXO-CTERM domain-containing protein